MPIGFEALTIPSGFFSPAIVSTALAAVSTPKSAVVGEPTSPSSESVSLPPASAAVGSSPAVQGSQAASLTLTSASVVPTSVTVSTAQGSQASSVVISAPVALSSTPFSSKSSSVAGEVTSKANPSVVSSTSFPPSENMPVPPAQSPSTVSEAPITRVTTHAAAPTQDTGLGSQKSAPPSSAADSKASNSPAPAAPSNGSQASATPKPAATSPPPSSAANSTPEQPSKFSSVSLISVPQSVSHVEPTTPSLSKTSVVTSIQSDVVPSEPAQVSSLPPSQPSTAVPGKGGNGSTPSRPAVSDPQNTSPAQTGNQNVVTGSGASQDQGNTPKPGSTLASPISVVITSNHRTIVTTPPVITSISTSRLPNGSSTTVTNIIVNPTTPTVKTTSFVTPVQPTPETQSGSIKSSGFWNNHGAVEAVFVILGLIIVGITAFGIFWCRRWRNRRRAINWAGLLDDHHGPGSSGAPPQMSMNSSAAPVRARGASAGYLRDYVVDDPRRGLTTGSVRSGELGESSTGHGGPGSVPSSPGHYPIAHVQSANPAPLGLSQIATQGLHTPPYLTPFSDYYQVQPSPLELDAPAGFAGVGAGANASRIGQVSTVTKRKEPKVLTPASLVDLEPLKPPVRPYTHSITPSTPSMYPPSLPPTEDDASIYSQDTAKQVEVDASGPASTAPLVPSKAKAAAAPATPTRSNSQLPTPDDDDYDKDFKDWEHTDDVVRKQASGSGSGSSLESVSSSSATKEGYKPVTPPDSLLLSSPAINPIVRDRDLTTMSSLVLDKVHQPQPQNAKPSMISTPPDSPTDWVHRQPALPVRPPPIPRPLRSPLRPLSSAFTTRTLKTNMDN